MFESIVATLINRFLGSYIENFDSKSLNIGIWSGDVRLTNLTLKKESLDKFKLPLDVKFGHLGKLTLLIPWSNLKGKPVKVVIEDVYLLASPIILADYDADEDNRRAQAIKQDKLKDLEAMQSALNSNNDLAAEKNNELFTESLVTKIVDNLQVTIKNIHIRYEDQSILTESPYSLGLSLSELSASSTDENWEPSFISITQSFTRKLLVLRSFACYMNTESESIYSDNPEEILSSLKTMFAENSASYQYLLKPVSGEGHVVLHKAGATQSHPQIKAELFFEEFGIDFDSSQYRDMLWTASKFHWYQKTWKFRRFRPKVPLDQSPKEWFLYAAKSVLNEIHEKNYKWSWESMKKRRDQRKLYTKLWKMKLLRRALSESETAEFKALEEDLSYEDIKFYRSLTRAQIREDKLVAPASDTHQASSSGSWFSWWGGGQNKQEHLEATESDGGLDLTLTSEQRQALYDTIGYDENKLPTASDLPRDCVTMEVYLNLKKGGISLKPHKQSKALAEVVFEGCQSQFFQRPDSFLAKFQLHGFRIEDGTPKPLYKHIVSVKHDHGSLHESPSDVASTSNDPFFQFSFENNPLDGVADSALMAKLKSMTIFYNHFFIEEVINFFKPPKIHLDTVGAIMNAAEATMEGLTSQTRMGLQYALTEHKTINLQLDLQAPLVIVPLDPTSWKSSVAILDAGHVSISSELVDRATIEEFSAKESYTKADWAKFNTLMYDKFNLHLHDTQFLIGHSIKSTMEQLHSQSKTLSAVILDDLDIKISLGVSILPDAANLARFKVSGEVPGVNMALNDFQYKTLMKLIDVMIPTETPTETDSTSVFDAYGSSEEREIAYDSDSEKEKIASKALSSQHVVEIDFKVSTVTLALSRCINGVTLETEHMIDIVGDSISFLLWKTENDMHIDISLTDVNIIDHIEKSGIPEFEKLISSNNFSEEDEIKKQNTELVKLAYDRNQRIVELNEREIEVYDQNIVLDMSALKCVVSRKSFLSLLNFTLNTFTDPNVQSKNTTPELQHSSSEDESLTPEKINVTINLEKIILVLNEEGIKLATLQLSTALIGVLVLPEELEVNGKLGALSLHDESNQGSPRDSILRTLISIEGDNLAEFTYKTFDPHTNREKYQSSIEFTTGATKINFVEDSFSKILGYLSKFQKMKAIYDAARDAALNQAGLIDSANDMKMVFLVRAPTIYFPKLAELDNETYDMLVAELGELYLNNSFEDLSDGLHNVMKAGLRNVNLCTYLNFEDQIKQVGKVVEDLDISFDIDYAVEHSAQTPTLVISSKTKEIEMKLTELQLKYMYNLQNSISQMFQNQDEDSLDDIEEDAEYANAVMKHDTSNTKDTTAPDKLNVKELSKASVILDSNHEKVALKFEIPRISLTLYNRTRALANFESTKLSSLAINGVELSFNMREDTNFDGKITISSFTILDVREGSENKFTEIIPFIEKGEQQFSLNATSSGESNNQTTTLMLTITKPKILLALDLIFELQSFANKGLELDSLLQTKDEEADEEESNEESLSIAERSSIGNLAEAQSPETAKHIGVSINVIEPSVILLADSSKADTEALVFKVEQVLVTSQNIMSLAVKNVGMHVTRMDCFEDYKMRIIDDFSASFALDSRGSTPTELLTSMQLSIDLLLIRISLRDIRLAIQIFERANGFYLKAQEKLTEDNGDLSYDISDDLKQKITKYAPSELSSLFMASKQATKQASTEVLVKGEEFEATFGGVRLVLIGDVNELPVLDMGLKPAEAKITNWSTEMNAETHIESYINIYNYSKSTWEPLLESWPISVYASKTLVPSPSLMVEVVSREIAQLSISSRSVALISQIASSITAESVTKSREKLSSYVINNETGFDIEVWKDKSDDLRENLQTVPSRQKINWEFEDWRTIRENLDTDSDANVLGLKLVNSKYDPVYKISASGEGEEVFVLNPPVNGVHNRLAIEIKLGSDNVKTIHLRSTVTVQNNAESAVSLMSFNKARNTIDTELVVEPGQKIGLPIDVVYNDDIKIRPKMTTNFNWSTDVLSWRSLMQRDTSLCCSSIVDGGSLSNYYFQAEAQFDKDEPLNSVYPHITIVISAPLEIENLLPFDFNFRLYDKSSKKDWRGHVKQGKNTYVQVVTLESLLLLSVEPLADGFGNSEFAIINTRNGGEFKREYITSVKNENGQVVQLKFYYPKLQKSKSSLKVVVYSPYIILNRTGQRLLISDQQRASQSTLLTSTGGERAPQMFSFEKDGDRLNRALVRLGDSQWSAPLGFDAIGQVSGVTASVPGRNLDMNFGISIGEGEGKYNLTKVISIVPRYVVRNTLKESITIAESGSSKQFEIEPGQVFPVYLLRRTEEKTMIMKFSSQGLKWSAPFAFNDIGQVFLKVEKMSTGQILLKVNIITENGTIFVQIENANNSWPFSVRNFTDSEFYIYQSNPNLNRNGEVAKRDVDYKPIYYKVPAKSVMPYSYDYPNAIIKEVIIRSHGRERTVNLAEIGNLKPFRLPETTDQEQVIVDLNVVADGPTQSLVITDYNPSVSLYKLQDSDNSSASLSQQQFEVDTKDENYFTKIFTRFEGFGLSFINTRSQELCYLSLRGLELRYNESDLYQNLSMKLKWVQLDNQLYGGIFPIILYPTLVPKSGKGMSSHPSLSASICKVKDNSHGVTFIKYATILLQEMSVEIDEDFLFALLDFSKFPGATWNSQVEDKLCDDDFEIPEPSKLSEASDIYFEALHLQPTLTNLSFVRTERVNAEDKSSSQNTLMFFVNMLTMAIGNINDAPIKLNALFIENVRVPIPILMQSILTHYGQSFFYQLHKILGSADFLGNPVGLFNNISSGVLDIFYEPYQGLVMNDRPQEIGIGIAKGGLSFIKKSVFGFSDSFAKVTGSLAKGLSVATMDRKFQERRRLNQRRNRPKHALYGFTSGANSFFESISSGVTGIALAPLEGASKEGAGGFFKGIGKGVIGLPTKTAIGLFDLASNVSEGIRNTTTVFDTDGLEKVRLPRYISYDNVVRPYSQREAQGQYWLKSVDGGEYFDETYLAHLVLAGEDKAVIVTFKRIILFEVNSLKATWAISFNQIKSLSLETTGVGIILSNGKRPFIPVPEKRNREFLYSRMKIAVDKFNSKCQVQL